MTKLYLKILLIIALLLIAKFSGIYLDEFSDIVFSTIFTGLFQTEPGTIFNNYECLFIIAKLIQKIQSLFSFVNIYGLAIVLINTYCIYTIILLFTEFTIFKNNKAIYLTILLSIVSILIHDFIFIQFTKTSMLCNFIGIYHLLYSDKKLKQGISLIICGLLLRSETFWLVLIFTMCIHIISQRIDLTERIKRRKYIWFIILITGVTISVFNKRVYTEDDKRYESFRTYKYTILDFTQKNNKRLLLTKKDSVKLFCLQHAFFSDNDSLLSINTFKQLSIDKHNRIDLIFFLKSIIQKENLYRSFKIFNELVVYYNSIYLLWLSILLAILIFLLEQKEYLLFRKVLMSFSFLLIFILFITIYIKMENRVLEPLLIITLYYLFKLTDSVIIKNTNNLSIKITTGVICIMLLYFDSEFYYKYKHRTNLHTQSQKFLSDWNMTNSDKLLIPDLFSWEVFFSSAISNPTSVRNIKLFSLDGGYLSMMENHLTYMNNIVKSNHFKDYIDYVVKNKQDIYFFGNDERIRLLQNYVLEVYNINLQFVKSEQKPLINEQGSSGYMKLFLYKVSLKD